METQAFFILGNSGRSSNCLCSFPISNLKIDETGNIQICLIFSGRKPDDAGSLQAQKVPRRLTKTQGKAWHTGSQSLLHLYSVNPEN